MLTRCTTLPCPEVASGFTSDPIAVELLEKSSEVAGHPWQRLKKVTVTFEGNWATLARALQPVLVDADYRQTTGKRRLRFIIPPRVKSFRVIVERRELNLSDARPMESS